MCQKLFMVTNTIDVVHCSMEDNGNTSLVPHYYVIFFHLLFYVYSFLKMTYLFLKNLRNLEHA